MKTLTRFDEIKQIKLKYLNLILIKIDDLGLFKIKDTWQFKYPFELLDKSVAVEFFIEGEPLENSWKDSVYVYSNDAIGSDSIIISEMNIEDLSKFLDALEINNFK